MRYSSTNSDLGHTKQIFYIW